MADYTALVEAGSALVELLREELTPEPIGNRELADLIHVSEGRFSHLFKESAGMAPLQYINKVRLEKAANLLKRGDYTVAEVANAVGFSDYNHFGRLFRRAFGCTPLEARKNSRIV